MTYPREQRLRRDLNDLLMYRDGKVEASKVWCNVGCGIVAYWMITTPALVWSEWVASLAIASALIAPDVLRKVMASKVPPGTTTTSSEMSTTTTTKAHPEPT